MSRDIALLSLAEDGSAGARVYFWDSVCVTLGRNQKPEDALFDLSINHTVRPTGGAAVLHGHDLTIGLAMPLTDLSCTSREVKKAYLGLVSPIIAALNAAGVSAALGRDIPDRESLASPYCFGMKSDYDVLNRETGEKICGCAMRVTSRAALLQASIPVGEPSCEPQTILRNYMPTKIIEMDIDAFLQSIKLSLNS